MGCSRAVEPEVKSINDRRPATRDTCHAQTSLTIVGYGSCCRLADRPQRWLIEGERTACTPRLLLPPPNSITVEVVDARMVDVCSHWRAVI